VADFETKLRWLSERGDPIGPDELIERIEAELAGNPLVVMSDRQDETPVVGTQKRPIGNRRNRSTRFAWGVALVAIVVTVAGLNLVLAGNRNPLADDPAVSTLVTPDGGTTTDLEVIGAGVDALYSGDADRAVELFELPAPYDDDWLRAEAAYQAAIGGRLAPDCTPLENPGVFSCLVPYQNAFTDAIGWIDSPGDLVRVTVVGGVITEFAFPVHAFLEGGLTGFLAETGSGDSECGFQHSTECALVVMGDLDAWAAWAENNLERPRPLTDLEIAETGVEALYSGYADGAAALIELSSPACCNGRSTDDWIRETVTFHASLGGRASAECVEEETPGWFTCTVSHQNLFTDVIGWFDPPGETIRVAVEAGVITEFDRHLRLIHDALNRFLQEQATLQEQGLLDLGDSRCSFSNGLSPLGWLTEDCIDYVMAHLDDWIAWAEVNLDPPPRAASPVISAGVDALYSGDADRASELFELADRDDDEIRMLAAFEAAIEGRLALSCWDRGPGRFDCFANYQNALTDAIGSGPPGDGFSAVVEDGVITEFYFPEHTYLMAAVANYLRVEGDPVCAREFFTEYPAAEGDAPPTTACVSVIMEKLDDWAAWYETNGMD
jgi:hypothetical protein